MIVSDEDRAAIEKEVRATIRTELTRYAVRLNRPKDAGESQTAFAIRQVRAEAWFDAASIT